jgi:hypothetical protein
MQFPKDGTLMKWIMLALPVANRLTETPPNEEYFVLLCCVGVIVFIIVVVVLSIIGTFFK